MPSLRSRAQVIPRRRHRTCMSRPKSPRPRRSRRLIWRAMKIFRLTERANMGRGSDELQLAGGEEHHAQQEPAVFPTLDVGLAIGALAVADGHVGDLEVEA